MKKLVAVSMIALFGLGGCANNPLGIQDGKDGAIKGGITGAIGAGALCALTGKNVVACAVAGGVAGAAIGHHYGLSIEEAKKVAAEIQQESHYRVAVNEGYTQEKQTFGGYKKVAYVKDVALVVPKRDMPSSIASRTLNKMGQLAAKTGKHTVEVDCSKKEFSYIAQSIQSGSSVPLNIMRVGYSRNAKVILKNDVMMASNA